MSDLRKSDLQMSDDSILYCLQELAGFEPEDIECDDFDVAVNDDQFAQGSIVRTAELSAALVAKLNQENQQLTQLLADEREKANARIEELEMDIAMMMERM